MAAFQLYLMADLEKMCGWRNLAGIYLVSGMVGNAASAVFIPYRAETGPSGAIFGVFGAFIVEVTRAWGLLRSPGLALGQMLLLISVFLLAGFVPWVDNYAHVFGFLAGLLLANGLLPSVEVGAADADAEARSRYFRLFCSFLALLLLLGFVAAFYLLGRVARNCVARA